VPGLGGALSGIGGVLASTDDPEELVAFPPYPYSYGGPAFGISRAPLGDPRGMDLIGNQSSKARWTNGPAYSVGQNRAWAPGANVMQDSFSQPMFVAETEDQAQSVNDILPEVWYRIKSEGGAKYLEYRDSRYVWDQSYPAIGMQYAALWGIDLETLWETQERILYKTYDGWRVITKANMVGGQLRQTPGGNQYAGPGWNQTQEEVPVPERAPLKQVLEARWAVPVAEEWQRSWSSQTNPVFDSSIGGDLTTWEERGAASTWMNEVEGVMLNFKTLGSNDDQFGYRFIPSVSLEQWTQQATPEAQAAFDFWNAKRELELAKYEQQSYPWYQLKAEAEAEAQLAAWQAEQEALYWAAFNSGQSAMDVMTANLAAGTTFADELEQPSPDIPQTSLVASANQVEPAMPIATEEAIAISGLGLLLLL
jgi:hypothetical protein